MERMLPLDHVSGQAGSANTSDFALHLNELFGVLVRFEAEVSDAVDARLRSELELPLSAFLLLSSLSTHGPSRVNDLAGWLGLSVGGTSKLVDRAEAADLCSRRPNPEDGRSAIVELTPSGHRVVAEAGRVVEGVLRTQLGTAIVSAVQSATGSGRTVPQALRSAADTTPRGVINTSETMRAIVLDAPGPASHLVLRNVPRPEASAGWVLIKVKAFGLNRSELFLRLGLAEGVTFPRVPGIEATGIVEACPGGEFAVGRQVATMGGGMGRVFDGGYAEYVCVPARQVIPFHSELSWSTLGAVPEMLQTAHGSLTLGLDAQPGQSILIRGGTSSIGMATAVLAKRAGMLVLSTTRSTTKTAALDRVGVDHVLIDDGNVSAQVRAIIPAGVDAALELVGTTTLPDTLRATRMHGVVCFTGMLGNQWIVKDFYPIDYLPMGVRLTAYGGGAENLPATVLQEFLNAVQAGEAVVPIGHVYRFEEIVEAHLAMEAGTASGKLVVTT